MSEYQYYEFCKLNEPLTTVTRKEMHALSSRAKVTTHGAAYVYNYGDFKGDPKKLLLKHFDVFFYISNWGSIQLIFKYRNEEINGKNLKKFLFEDIISCEKYKKYLLLNIDFCNEDGFGWIDGEGMLPDLLPLYDEIKSGNNNFLRLIVAINNGVNKAAKNKSKANTSKLSPSQKAFFEYAGIDIKIINK